MPARDGTYSAATSAARQARHVKRAAEGALLSFVNVQLLLHHSHEALRRCTHSGRAWCAGRPLATAGCAHRGAHIGCRFCFRSAAPEGLAKVAKRARFFARPSAPRGGADGLRGVAQHASHLVANVGVPRVDVLDGSLQLHPAWLRRQVATLAKGREDLRVLGRLELAVQAEHAFHHAERLVPKVFVQKVRHELRKHFWGHLDRLDDVHERPQEELRKLLRNLVAVLLHQCLEAFPVRLDARVLVERVQGVVRHEEPFHIRHHQELEHALHGPSVEEGHQALMKQGEVLFQGTLNLHGDIRRSEPLVRKELIDRLVNAQDDGLRHQGADVVGCTQACRRLLFDRVLELLEGLPAERPGLLLGNHVQLLAQDEHVVDKRAELLHGHPRCVLLRVRRPQTAELAADRSKDGASDADVVGALEDPLRRQELLPNAVRQVLRSVRRKAGVPGDAFAVLVRPGIHLHDVFHPRLHLRRHLEDVDIQDN
eukprot:scaffold3469_cov246-Pinguiococcus_pyrenoidosus.AAC.3